MSRKEDGYDFIIAVRNKIPILEASRIDFIADLLGKDELLDEDIQMLAMYKLAIQSLEDAVENVHDEIERYDD